jgi:outer membrane autotransporter protein
LRLGGFIGGGQTRSDIDLNTGDTRSDLIFGGVFARYFWGNSYLQGVVQVGHSRTDTSRNINNNLLPNGLETATASYDGWYVSPEVTYGLHYGLGSLAGAVYTLTPSLQLRYLYASFDGYTENGTTAPLTVGTRTAGDFEERGQLKLTRTQVFTPTEVIMTSIYGGVLGVQRVGSNTIGAVLLGQAIPFATPGDDNVWGGFGGAGIEVRTRNVAMFLSGEYLAFSDSSNIVSGKAGIRVSF